jgi:hypothetical protein
MTNYGSLAILAIRPKPPDRQLRFLIALETVTARDGGWRTIETGVLAAQSGQAVRTASKARAELAKAGRIEYRPGTGPGHPGSYRLLVDVDSPPGSEPGKNAAPVNPGKNAAPVNPGKNAAPVNPGKQAPGSQANEPQKPTTPNAVTSANASIALEPSALEPSALLRAARDPHNILTEIGADERLTKYIITTLEDHGIGDVTAYLLKIIGKGPREVRGFLGRARRALGADDHPGGYATEPEPSPKPPWCGKCDPHSRFRVTEDEGRPYYCPECHHWPAGEPS